MEVLRTDGSHPDFIRLVRELDQFLTIIDGDDHAFYHQFNSITDLHHAVVVYAGPRPVACGAIKYYSPGVMEVKRMYTDPEFRGQGMASAVLRELETWAREMGCKEMVLETGIRQPDAIALYQKHGFHRVPNYGQYAGIDSSVCFSKSLAV